MLDFINNLLIEYQDILVTMGIVSAVIFIISLLLTPWLLGKIPADYFVKCETCKSNIIITTLKNIIGLILLLAGIIMLVTPGQGIISILLGLFLMEFPGKRKLELKLINSKTTFKTLNWLRSKVGKPPFEQ
ncbi:MAG: hypothetical protein Ctma_0421 [Catillopecten margaritatus gill symbiont]|uniref:Transmembrane protein (PGPGW) n=1 Tax=Catillopecten margaritatus gill symbiont TaxID=3083288 RepID=A0AAU6PFD2_9GAMM